MRRHDIFPARRTLQVVNQAQEINGLGRDVSGPESEAGKRTVTLPKMAMNAPEQHRERFTGPEPDAIVFTAVRGGPVRRARLSIAWTAANNQGRSRPRAPATSSTKEVMARGGHSSPRAALRYQHAAEERDQEVADFMDDQIVAAGRPQRADIVTLRNDRKDFGRMSPVRDDSL